MTERPLRFVCDRRFGDLPGAGPVRHCDRCDTPVVDLSALTAAARAAFLDSGVGGCVRVAAAGVLGAAFSFRAFAEDPPAAEAPNPPPEPAADAGEVMGALDVSGVRAAISAQHDALSAAYRDRLAARPGLAGSLTVAFTISEGAVTDAAIRTSTVADPELEAAVLAIVRGIAFAPGGTVRVSYPFTFAP